MNTQERFSPQKTPMDNQEEGSRDPHNDQAMIDFASALDDFMDEEVVDNQGIVVGTLACYWLSVSGRLVFLGIKVNEGETIRVVPGRRSQVDDRHGCILLGFDAEDIRSAPSLDCAGELDPILEKRVYDHFAISEPEPHGGLRPRGQNLK